MIVEPFFPASTRPRFFRTWLRMQRHRDDPVGDLARDVVQDPFCPSFKSLREWVTYVGVRGPVYGALIAAWREFAGEAGTSPRQRRPPRDPQPRSISPRQRARILERDRFRCRRCGTGPGQQRLVVDHILPVALGGTCDDDNLQTLCEPCNQGKGDREPHAHDLRPGGAYA